MTRIVRTGVTRSVLLAGRVVIKFPTLRYGWSFFLRGLLANLQEREWWRATRGDPRLCPVLWSSCFGFWLLMRYAEDIDLDELPSRDVFEGLPVDYKPDNFGWLNGLIVLRDYGS